MTRVRAATPADRPDVAALAATAHRRLRAEHPLLPAALDAAAAWDALAGRAGDGFVAEAGGRVVAAWTAKEWSGQALASLAGVAGDAQALVDIYAVAARTWVDAGLNQHAAMVRCTDVAQHDALVDLGFGHQQAYAVASLDALSIGSAPAEITVEQVAADRIEDILALAEVLPRHQGESPVFAPRSEEWFAQLRQRHQEELAQAEATYLLATLGGVPAGLTMTYDGEAGPVVPENAVEVSVAATRPEFQGRGVAGAMLSVVVRDAAAAGRTSLVCDWRTTNLLASRYWRARGLRPLAHRMNRTIDARPVD